MLYWFIFNKLWLLGVGRMRDESCQMMAFDNFRGVNTLTMADFALPASCQNEEFGSVF